MVLPGFNGVAAVTRPDELTVATEVLEEVHGLEEAAVPDPVKVVVLKPQISKVPVMVGRTGVNSSAPISGVDAFRVSASISVVIPVIGVPAPSR